MRAGDMKHRLQILKPTTEKNGYGETTTEFVAMATVHAQLIKDDGRRSEEVGEHFPDYNKRFNIRDAHSVEENWRVQQLGGYLYTVISIIHNIDKGMKTLICSRVNE